MEIHQLLAGFVRGDAISNYALELQKIFHRWGYHSRIFVSPDSVDSQVRHLCHPLNSHKHFSSPDNILIYHFSIGSMATEHFYVSPDIKIVIYHNITPSHFFRGVEPKVASLLDQGRKELVELSPVVELALGVSEYNRRELEEAGFSATDTIPLTLPWEDFNGKSNRWVRCKHFRGRDNILFVGRIVPNKKIEDLIKVFYYYKLIKPSARLFLVGKHSGFDRYIRNLKAIVEALSLKDVYFTGSTSHSQLSAYYKLARVYLCLSEHEGFCLPLMEAMHFGLPVLAYAAAAVPDTLNGAGVLIKEKNYPEIAEMAARLSDDKNLRKAIVEGQYKRLNEFRTVSLEDRLKEHLGQWLGH